jgi:hypothetical protein
MHFKHGAVARHQPTVCSQDHGAQPAGDRWGEDPRLVQHRGQSLHGTGTPDDPQVLSFLAGALPNHAGTAAMFGGGDLLPLMVEQLRFLHFGAAAPATAVLACSEPFSSGDFADLVDVDGFGEVAGLPGTAA